MAVRYWLNNLPLWLFAMILLVLLVVIAVVEVVLLRRRHFFVRFVFLMCSIGLIIFFTVLGRTAQNRTVHFIPFFWPGEKREERDFYSSLLKNVFLFVPFGASFSLMLPDRWKNGRRIFVAVLTGVCISILVEIVQYFCALGLAETDDVLANTLGTFLGTTHLLLEKQFEAYRKKRRDSLPFDNESVRSIKYKHGDQ